MISHIFAFLKFKDIKVASIVCWSWYNVTIQPRFLKNEVICLKNMKTDKMIDVLKIYTKSLRPFFAFSISVEEILPNCDWVYTVWSFLGAKVVYLEVFVSTKLNDGILPALLNVTKQLKVLKIHNLHFFSEEELYKVNRFQSLEELVLDTLEIHNIDKKKLMGIIPKQLRKLCLIDMLNSNFILEDLTEVFKLCSSHLVSLELTGIDVTLALMESIVSLNMKLEKFALSLDFDQGPEVILPLFKTQWPLVDLQLRGECLTHEHLLTITNKFKDLQHLSVTGKSISSFEEIVGIDGSTFNSITKITKSINSLKKLKTLYIGSEK
jgi:hypothetical protein